MNLIVKTLVCFFAFILSIEHGFAQFWKAEDLTIFPNDLAHAADNLQLALNRSDVTTIWFSSNAALGDAIYLLNKNIVVPEGKVLKFEKGNRLSGDVTVYGATIEATNESWIFETGITLIPYDNQVNGIIGKWPCKTTQGTFSVKWFGAKGNNVDDDYLPIQKSIDASIVNGMPKLQFPAGRYRISSPLIARRRSGNPFFTLDIFGETTVWGSQSVISTDFNNTFALGIQHGKGCKVRNLGFEGKFSPPSPANKTDFYNCPMEEFYDQTQNGMLSRDSRFSPYAAIVIEPFSNKNEWANSVDVMYPGLESEYQSPFTTIQSSTGSSGISIEDVSINGFVVGICSSPNGFTQNQDFFNIRRVKVSACKIGVSGGQNQEKLNVIDGLAAWSKVHTVFATNVYGDVGRGAGNWIIQNVNIAGGVVQFIFNGEKGDFPSYIKNVYAESIGSFGSMFQQHSISRSNGTQVSDCIFDFEPYLASRTKPLINTNEGFTFKNCAFRFNNGRNEMMLINSYATFEDCKFSGVPVNQKQLRNDALSPNFINCTAGTYILGGNLQKTMTKNFSNILNNNRITLTVEDQAEEGKMTEIYSLSGQETFVRFMENDEIKSVEYNSENGDNTRFPGNPDLYEDGQLIAFCNASSSSIFNEMSVDPLYWGIVTKYQSYAKIDFENNSPMESEGSGGQSSYYWQSQASPYSSLPINSGSHFMVTDARLSTTNTSFTSQLTYPNNTFLSDYKEIQIRFRSCVFLETGSTASVEVSINNGATWTNVFTLTSPTTASGSFQSHTITLPANMDNPSNFSFRFKFDCQNNHASFWAVDQVEIWGIYSNLINVEGLTNHFNFSQQYKIAAIYPATHKGTFLGDITEANKISNIIKDFGESLTEYKNHLIKTPYNNSLGGWVKVLNYDEANRSFTVYGNKGSNFPELKNGLYFHNDAQKKIATNSKANQTNTTITGNFYVMYKGEEIIELDKSDDSQKMIVCKTGVYPSNLAPAGETRIAEFCPPNDAIHWNVTGNNISENKNIFGTLSNDDIRIKTNNTDAGIITKTGRFGMQLNNPEKTLDVNGETRIRQLPTAAMMNSVVMANGDGDLKSLAANGNPMYYLSGLGTWMPLIQNSIQAGDGLTLTDGIISLGDKCNNGQGAFTTDREINQGAYNLYFITDEKGKLYMGVRQSIERCYPLTSRLEISSSGLDAINDYDNNRASLSGLRFTELKADNNPIPNRSNGVLSLDKDGDVIWVESCCTKKENNEMEQILNRLNILEKELKASKEEIKSLKQKIKSIKLPVIGAAILSILLSTQSGQFPGGK